MQVKGFEGLSLIDWDGVPCSVIFLGGCNFRCPFCHNSDLVLNPEKLRTWNFNIPVTGSNIMIFLASGVWVPPDPGSYHYSVPKGFKGNIEECRDYSLPRRVFEGVCITGGEPTLHKELPEMCKEIKSVGLKVKLDTNGTNFSMLSKLIKEKLIDYVAMDIKAPLTQKKYSLAIGRELTLKQFMNISHSINLLLSLKNFDYEFRTTVVPTLHSIKDIEQICRDDIQGAKKYIIQNFVPNDKVLNPDFWHIKPFSAKKMEEFANVARPYVQSVKIRNIQNI